jgi:type IV secretory pathway TrbD component
MSRDLVTRRTLTRELVLNAASRPLNLVVPAGVAAASLVLEAAWLLPFAVAVYLAMAVATFFDGAEAERVGRAVYERSRLPERRQLETATLARPIARKLEQARAEEARIRDAIEQAAVPRFDVTDEVARLMVGLDKLAERAQQIHAYLATQDEAAVSERLRVLRAAPTGNAAVDAANADAAAALEEQLHVAEQLEQHLARFDAQMEHAIASLSSIHGQIVRMNATEEAAAQRDVAGDVRSLRREINVTADAMSETYDIAETRGD